MPGGLGMRAGVPASTARPSFSTGLVWEWESGRRMGSSVAPRMAVFAANAWAARSLGGTASETSASTTTSLVGIEVGCDLGLLIAREECVAGRIPLEIWSARDTHEDEDEVSVLGGREAEMEMVD